MITEQLELRRNEINGRRASLLTSTTVAAIASYFRSVVHGSSPLLERGERRMRHVMQGSRRHCAVLLQCLFNGETRVDLTIHN